MFTSSSGSPVSATTIAGGLVGGVAVLPLSGSDSQPAPLTGGSLDATGPVAGVVQVLPRALTVTSIAAKFQLSQALSLVATTITLSAQLYTDLDGDNTFDPVPGAQCDMAPTLVGAVGIGNTSKCLVTGLNIPMNAETPAVMVVSATATGVSLVNIVTGYASTSVAAS